MGNRITLLLLALPTALLFWDFDASSLNPNGETEMEFPEDSLYTSFRTELVGIFLDFDRQYNVESAGLDMFSKCPSGYDIETTTIETAYAFGQVVYFSGCAPLPVCNFKVDMHKEKVWLKGVEETKYVPLKKWMKLYYKKTGKTPLEDVIELNDGEF